MSTLDDTRAIPQAQQQSIPRDNDLVEWLHRIAGGDQKAFAHLYDALSDEVRLLAAATFTDTRAVDAVLAATFLHVWRSPPTLDPKLVRAWVGSVASNLIAQRQNTTRHTSSSGRPTAYSPTPWASMSSTYDESVCAVLAIRLNRRSPRRPAGGWQP